MADRYDVAVVGGGPGGYAAALYGAAAGLEIALVEADRPGGTCLLRGCIPAKELLQTAEVFRTVARAGEFGVQASAPTIDWPSARGRQGKVVEQLVTGLSGLLKKRKVTIVKGFGRVSGRGIVDVDTGNGTERIEADAVIVAAGSRPSTIPGFEIDGRQIVTSDQALFFDDLPDSIAIVGGGVIGCEFATTFVDLGVEVLLLEALDQLIPGADPDVVRYLQRDLSKRGVDIRLGATVTGHRPAANDLVTVSFEHKGEALEADMEKILIAVGRGPNTADMYLPEAGVEVDQRGFVKVDPGTMRTTLDGVYAVGDCVPTPALAHIAYAEAMVAIRDILGEAPRPVNYDAVPWCVYTHPELAWAGLTEQQARDAGYDVAVKKHGYGGVGRALIIGESVGQVKIVSDAANGTILGLHLCGPWATESLLEGYLSVNWEATVEDLAHLVHPHPTLSEAIGETVLAATGRGLHG